MAQSTRDIKRRIQSVQNTQQITKAMEMIAAAKLRKAQARVEKTRPYLDRIEHTVGRILDAARQEGEELPQIAQAREGNRHCLVVVTADRGLAGGYNANILRRAEQFLKENPDTQMIVVGRKGRDYFRRREQAFLAEYVNIGDEIDFRQAQEIGQVIQEFYLGDLFDTVSILYTKFINSVTHRITLEKILPFEQKATEDGQKNSGPKALYRYEPSISGVLSTMLPLFIDTAIYQALADANASEQGSRMSAMRNATDNAGEMIKALTLSFNRARQAAITTEISEIVGGAEALRS